MNVREVTGFLEENCGIYKTLIGSWLYIYIYRMRAHTFIWLTNVLIAGACSRNFIHFFEFLEYCFHYIKHNNKHPFKKIEKKKEKEKKD